MKKNILLNIVGCTMVLLLLLGCTQYRYTSYERPRKLIYEIKKGEYYYKPDRVYKIIYEEEEKTKPSPFEFKYACLPRPITLSR